MKEGLKQVIVVRKDLGMRKGKAMAQACHASRGAAEIARKRFDVGDEDEKEPVHLAWIMSGETKIVVGIEGKDNLVDLYHEVNDSGIPCKLVKDLGHTELEPGTPTAVGVGPAKESEIDEYTSHLELL